MAKPKVELKNSFNEWRIITNNLSDLIGDLANAYYSDGTGIFLEAVTKPTDLLLAVNDLNSRKVKRTGDNMIGTLAFTHGTLTANKPFIDATGTWNNAAVDFSGIKVDITNTASGAGSLLLDFRLAGVQKFGVDINGAVVQKLTGKFLARDVVSGSRHVREYQDLNDFAPAQNIGGAITDKENFEWGYTWNAGWDGAAYVKDRSNAGDHAIMMRTDKKFRQQWHFSDGTLAGSSIIWAKKVEFDFPSDTATFDLITTFNKNVIVGVNKLTVNASTGATVIAGTLDAGSTTITGTLSTSSTALLNSLQVSTTSTFGGVSTFNNQVFMNGGTVTASTPILHLTQTWNNANVVFSGFKFDVANTAAARGSLLLDFTQNGLQRFGVDSNGAIRQFVSGSFLSRDIVSKDLSLIPNARHIREYQDLDDGLTGTQGLDPGSVFEYGFTYNARWDSTTNTYVKDDTGASMHSYYERFTEDYKKQIWYSDGTTPGTPILWVKKLDFDFATDSYLFNGGKLTASTYNGLGITTTTGVFTLANGKTFTVNNTMTLIGTDATTMTFPSTSAVIARTDTGQTFTGNNIFTGSVTAASFIGNGANLTALNGSQVTTGTVADARIAAALTGKTYNGLTLTTTTGTFTLANAKTFTVSNTLTLSGSDGASLNIGSGGVLGSAAFTPSTQYEPAITTLTIAKGGTGINTLTGQANKVLGVNASGTTYEFKSYTSSDGTISITHGVGTIDIKSSGIFPGSVTFQGDLSVGSPIKFSVAATSGNITTAGNLNVAGITTLAVSSATTFTATNKIVTPVADIGDSVTFTTVSNVATMSPVVIASFPIATYRSACFEIQAVDSANGKFHRSNLNVIHNGTLVDYTEYGITLIGAEAAQYSVAITGGNIELRATPSTLSPTTFKVRTIAMKI